MMHLKIFCLICFCVSRLVGQETYLVFGGKTGWIGGQLVELIKKQGHRVYCAQSRLEDRQSIELEIDNIKPTLIINAAGKTGVPNIDWCEDHKLDVLRANVIGALVLADVACAKGIHLTVIGTGCIYEYDQQHPIGGNVGFTEQDEPNFTGSFYSFTKGLIQKLLAVYPNVLLLRVRMPISADLHPRNFVTKIMHYKKVVNIPNSMTVLDDLLPIVVDMSCKRLTGTYNFVNPGAISHNEILDLYIKYVDQNFMYQNFSIEEQDKILKARRSNNVLDTSKLLKIYSAVPDIKTSIVRVVQRIRTGRTK